MLSHLQDQPALSPGHLQGVQDGGQAFVELDVHHSADDGNDAAVGDDGLGGRGNIAPLCEGQAPEDPIILLKNTGKSRRLVSGLNRIIGH